MDTCIERSYDSWPFAWNRLSRNCFERQDFLNTCRTTRASDARTTGVERTSERSPRDNNTSINVNDVINTTCTGVHRKTAMTTADKLLYGALVATMIWNAVAFFAMILYGLWDATHE